MFRFLLLTAVLVAALTSWTWGESEPHEESHRIDWREYLVQPDGISCGPTSVLMVLRAYGIEADAEEVQADTNTRWFAYRGEPVGMASPHYMLHAMNRGGLPADMETMSLSSLKRYVGGGRPVIVLLRSDRFLWHYVVVTGYDVGHVIVADPSFGDSFDVPDDVFVGSWRFVSGATGDRYVSGCRFCRGGCVFCGVDCMSLLLKTVGAEPMTGIVPRRPLGGGGPT